MQDEGGGERWRVRGVSFSLRQKRAGVFRCPAFLLIVLGILLSGTAVLSATEVATYRSTGSDPAKSSATLLRYLKIPGHMSEDKSAFHSLGEPRDAFAARIFLVDNARKSIEVQYYIYEDDQTGDFFSYHLLKAAERGVKVRILLDDLITSGKDVELKMMASHPNIELKLFNPNRLRRSFRNLALLFNVNSLGKRMHNKALIADGAAAIVGGRNIGDVYYAADNETLFFDYDILATGKIVSDICGEFELYWKSKEAISSKELLEGSYTDAQYKQEKSALLMRSGEFGRSQIGRAIADSDFAKDVRHRRVEMTVAKRAELYYDYPEKVASDEQNTSTHISAQIGAHLGQADQKILIISPYFIPSDTLMQHIIDMRAKGVEVTVITNSLASTDVFPVYSGYRWFIEDLLKAGVRLYELKPQSFATITRSRKWLKSHRTSLHTKMIVIDNDLLVVGSANLDPRSNKLNTELILVIDSPSMVKEKWSLVRKLLSEENFYRLSWERYPSSFEEDGIPSFGPVWHTTEKGEKRVYYAPPHSGFWRTLGTDLLSFLPIEGYL